MMKVSERQPRVGIRAITGTFAWDVLRVLRREGGFVPAVGIACLDPSLDRLVEAARDLPASERERMRAFFPKLMVVENENGNGIRKRVAALNASQDVFRFVAACDFDPLKECDVFVDLTRGAKQAFEVQYEDFARKKSVLAVFDTGKPESARGRLIVPPFLAPKNERDGNVIRLGDCVVSAINSLVGPLAKTLTDSRLARVGTTVFCILDAKLSDPFLLPERAHGLYFNAPPAPNVKACLRADLQVLFNDSWVETPAIIQAHALTHYALVLRTEWTGSRFSEEQVIAAFACRDRFNRFVMVAPKRFASTYDVDWELGRRLSSDADRLPPVVLFPGTVETEHVDGRTLLKIEAAVRYLDIGPRMCVEALRMITKDRQ